MEKDQTKKRPAGFWIGNLLIISSLAILAYIYLPVIEMYLIPPNPAVLSNTSYSIYIPKLNAFSPVIKEVDPWNETEYAKALEKGVAEAKGFASPGQKGTIFMFAHSSGMPWNMTRQNTIFFRLGELKKGDEIKIKKDGQDYLYLVTEKKEIWPSQVEELKIGVDQLILQTCTPIGTSLKRLLIFAKPLN